jgi:hypothetical protein
MGSNMDKNVSPFKSVGVRGESSLCKRNVIVDEESMSFREVGGMVRAVTTVASSLRNAATKS